MNKIKKVSAYLLVVFNMILLGLPLLIITEWVFMDVEPIKSLVANGALLGPVTTIDGTIYFSDIKWSPVTKLLGISANLFAILPICLSLIVLKQIFGNYKKAEIFTVTNARYYKQLGLLFFVDAFFAKPITHMLTVLAATFSNEPGHRYISLSFGTPNIEAIFCGVLVLVISWVMLEASRLNEEQELTI
jgi:hypothetical protein